MAKTIKCDRCETIIPPRSDGDSPTTIIFMPAGESDLPEYDLCVSCTQLFREWINPRSSQPRTRVHTTRDLPGTSRPRSP